MIGVHVGSEIAQLCLKRTKSVFLPNLNFKRVKALFKLAIALLKFADVATGFVGENSDKLFRFAPGDINCLSLRNCTNKSRSSMAGPGLPSE
jgi:hypothetical protein